LHEEQGALICAVLDFIQDDIDHYRGLAVLSSDSCAYNFVQFLKAYPPCCARPGHQVEVMFKFVIIVDGVVSKFFLDALGV
jgi:hypothetical protein